MVTTEAGETSHSSTPPSKLSLQRFYSPLTSPSQRRDDLQHIKRLVMVSNRLPIVLNQSEDGTWHVTPGSGGLVTALTPVLRAREGVWIGWPGTSEVVELDDLPTADGARVGYTLQAVPLSEADVDGYYRGFANEIIWPLFHDVQSRCHFDPAYWAVYQDVNRQFAQVVAQNVIDGDYIWVHDYHLMLVARYLREMGMAQQLGFFLHTPFPHVDVFIKLPWRQQILEGLLAYDLLGFQTLRDRNNFLACAAALFNLDLPAPRLMSQAEVDMSPEEALLAIDLADLKQPVVNIATDKRRIKVGYFSISIDFGEFDQMARTAEVVERVKTLREEIPDGKCLLGVDRLDYSKGVPERLEAFQCALERFPDLRGKLTLIQVVVPSRTDIPEYQHLRTQIEEWVSRINGQFGQPGWMPIHYLYRSLERSELVAYYRTADVALITPLKDGMNLIAKEYCAANVDCDGVLILSEFAGAASQLSPHALLVNPYDIHGFADVIHQACEMSPRARQGRMEALRQRIREQDIFHWLDTFLNVAMATESDASGLSRPSQQEAGQGERKPLISSAASAY